MSKINYHDSVSVDTEVKQIDDFESFNEANFQFFGLSEKEIQTELTMRDIIEIDNYNKELKEKNLLEQKNGKLDELSHQIDISNQNNKKRYRK